MLGKVVVEYKLELGCDKNFYGSDCSVWCVEDEHRKCDQDGNIKCRKEEDQDCNMITKISN